MGARWAWEAVCERGHAYGNFSGGADECYTCGAQPTKVWDCSHWASSEPCDCRAQAEAYAKDMLSAVAQ